MAKIEFYAKFLIVLITIIFIVSFIEYQTELRVDEDRISIAERSLEDFPLSIIQKPKQKIVCIPDVHGKIFKFCVFSNQHLRLEEIITIRCAH